MGSKSGCWLLFTTVLLLLCLPMIQADDFLAKAFRPLEGLDLGSFYEKHHPWVDFAVYLVLFVSLAQMTLGRRFGGREGRAVAIAIGLALAVALAAMERTMGFSLRSLGPLAAAVLLVIVGALIFYLARQMNLGISTSASVALVMVYFLVRATTPNFFLWLVNNQLAAWVNLVLVIAVMISLWNLATLAFSSRRTDLSSWGASLGQVNHWPVAASSAWEDQRLMNQEAQEALVIKNRLGAITRKTVKDSQEIIADIQEMIRVIREFGHDTKARVVIAQRIRDIAPKEAAILRQLALLIDLDLRLEKFDWKSFRNLKARLDKAPLQERERVKQEILAEKRKLISEERIKEFQKAFEKYDLNFRQCLKSAIDHLKTGLLAQSVDWLERAMKEEEEAMRVVQEMQAMENQLLKLTEIEGRVAKNEK